MPLHVKTEMGGGLPPFPFLRIFHCWEAFKQSDKTVVKGGQVNG
jgi:hypothetical protein